ncbi:hypothetical protein [Borreliella bavariensis]|uniref:hypothetical protein n=1 Tax=Borreliella bavariensis TaxID=664662 RepID=UPI001F1758B9|nr:hypothetical protein [Borreliella bavariensis]
MNSLIHYFFVNALKEKLSKVYTSTAHYFNLYLRGGVSQIEDHVKRILFKLKDKSKVKESLSYIKYGKDKQPNVKGRDDNNNIDVKDYYRVESSLASIFDNDFVARFSISSSEWQ